MTPTETKAEIISIIDTLPEEILLDVLNLIKEIVKKHEDEAKSDVLMEKIINDNSEVFKKLASL